jgi:hypothetical protein
VVLACARQRDSRRAAKRARAGGQGLHVLTCGDSLPFRPGTVGALLVEGLSKIQDTAKAGAWLADLAHAVRPGGLVLALDATDLPAVEARLTGLFLAARLAGISQERPREGALLTMAQCPDPRVVREISPRP